MNPTLFLVNNFNSFIKNFSFGTDGRGAENLIVKTGAQRFNKPANDLTFDEKGNPKGTIFKGAIAKEVTERWPAVAKVASIIV